MSGFEVVGIVFSIVSAFTGATKLLVEWKAKRRERAEKIQNTELLASLSVGGTEIRNEYDQDFARLGRLFAVGDERGRLELMSHLVTLQQTFITLLQRSIDIVEYDVLPNHMSILTTSNSTRASIIQSLAAQFQRLSRAATILKTLPSSEPVCRGKLGKHRWSAVGRLLEYPCRLCRATWTPLEQYHQHRKLYSVGDLHLPLSILVQEHKEDSGDIHCRVCSSANGRRTFELEINSIAKHLDTHTSSEIRAAYVSSPDGPGGRDRRSGRGCDLM